MPWHIEPMLATLSTKPFDSPDWLFELKMDGIRALVVKDGERFDMWTRNDRPLTQRFPTLAAALKELPGRSGDSGRRDRCPGSTKGIRTSS